MAKSNTFAIVFTSNNAETGKIFHLTCLINIFLLNKDTLKREFKASNQLQNHQ